VNEPEQVRLDGRDLEVLTLVTWGYSNQEIAEALCVSLTTAKTYIRFAYRRIGVDRRTQAVVWGFRHGLSSKCRTADVTAISS